MNIRSPADGKDKQAHSINRLGKVRHERDQGIAGSIAGLDQTTTGNQLSSEVTKALDHRATALACIGSN